MFNKFFAVLLLLAAAGCASHNLAETDYHPYENFEAYKPYEEKIICPLCFVEFLGEIPEIVIGK